MNFAAIVCEVDKHLAPDATVTTDAGNFGSFVHRYIGFRQGQIFLSSVVGAMGSGMPMAVAAALRRPGTQVVAFLGDGGALMMGNEIATACQYGANPIMIISDNGMYGTIGMHSYVRYPERAFMEGTKLTNPDFAAMGPFLWRRGHHDPHRGRSRRRHRPRLCGQNQACRGPLPDLGDPDERVAPLHPVRRTAVMRVARLIFSAADVRRKLRAVSALAENAGATEHERANAAALKARLQQRLKEAGEPAGDWTDNAFRLGKQVKELRKTVSPGRPRATGRTTPFASGRRCAAATRSGFRGAVPRTDSTTGASPLSAAASAALTSRDTEATPTNFRCWRSAI